MPRAESKPHLGAQQFYHSQFTNSQYLDSSTSSGSPPLSPASTHAPSHSASGASSNAAQKKKHVCGTCERAFTTSGHLARHSRVHTGERNHKCPFPGCETRCSRQDNLQQHYRIHLSPGSRRSSARTAATRSKRGSAASAQQASEPPTAPPALSSPPPLEQARAYAHHSTPPDSPPPLAQATLPATATLPLPNSRMDSDRLSSTSPDSYSGNGNLVPLGSQGLGLSAGSMNYNYRSGTTTYQEQSQGAGYTYVHTTPVSGSSAPANNFASYSNSQENYSQQHSRDNSPVSLSSRHSISHISHPHSAGPPSPASSHSVSSHTSGPPTPTYPAFHDDPHSYHHSNGMVADQSGMNGHPQSHLVHTGYSSNSLHQPARFNSPPPTLAPIQDERLVRRDEPRQSHSHHPSPYIHQPQPMVDSPYQLRVESPYHPQSLLGHGGWKMESGMRKGVNAALV